ncbi:MAG TPA: hypothetical protein VKE40_19445 [Gemmataceae bacterium]|nr:hypothetical protein [Gemmataceae bacterium]
MPRRHRVSTGGYIYHVLKRAVGRRTLFRKDGDYAAFLRVLDEARARHHRLLIDPRRQDEVVLRSPLTACGHSSTVTFQ